MREQSRTIEINEARRAGKVALDYLHQANDKLSSAKNWGLWDMLGGGFLTTMVKHSKIGDASQLMEAARSKLHIFQRELQDVQVPVEFRMEIGDFLTFADFFFDGIIADWMVQSRIRDAKRQVEDAIRKVTNIMSRLDEMERVIDVEGREV